MKTRLCLLAATFLAVAATAIAEPGAAIAIVYDTSGSMRETVAVGSKRAPKYIVVNGALNSIVDKVDAYAASGNKVEAGLFRFPGLFTSSMAVKFGPWNAALFRKWLSKFRSPDGSTPLGDAILKASNAVAASPLDKKHVVVLTDGENNEGISLEEGVRQGREAAKKNGSAINYYFIAFDTFATQFAQVKADGAMVLSAADGPELQKGLTTIFTEKILLENE